MDIEHFYDANPRRRSSEEFSFGRDWTDDGGTRWELTWVQDTGEVYLMRQAMEPIEEDFLGDSHVPDMPADVLTVEILGTLADRAQVQLAFNGWSAAMAEPNSVRWISERLELAREGQLPQEAPAGDPDPFTVHGANPGT